MSEPRHIRVSGQPPVVTVDMAREMAAKRYAAAFDEHATQEQLLRAQGRRTEAEGAHQYAMWVMRAYKAETRPEPHR